MILDDVEFHPISIIIAAAVLFILVLFPALIWAICDIFWNGIEEGEK